jgi:hypothetical protein
MMVGAQFRLECVRLDQKVTNRPYARGVLSH